MSYKCPTTEEFKARIAKIKEQEEKLGVKINFDESCVRDKDHLDCIWYGGEVGSIEYKGYKIVIGAYGDIRVSGIIDDEEVYFKDKNNSGEAYYELGRDINDERLYQLFDSEDEKEYLDWTDNNWFEVDLFDPDGNWIDLCGADNVLENNILDCFEGVDNYFEYVDWAMEGEI